MTTTMNARSWRLRLALAAAMAVSAASVAPADQAGSGHMHPDETATTFRPGDDLTVAFWCAREAYAEKAVEGVEEIARQLSLGHCADGRPDGLKVVLRDFMSGPYWFADDLTPWSLWAVETPRGGRVFALVPDTMGPHEPEKNQL